jgi:hypothetical protein
MTIFGTPGGTVNNTPPFQGTTPGNAAGASLPGITPGVGLFVPNSNNASGATTLSEQSRGNLPHNVLVTNAGRHAAGGRPLLESMSKAGALGYNGSAGGYDSLNSDANGGAGPGAGQANQTEGPSSGESSFVEGAAPATAPTLAAPTQYGG